MGDPRSLCEWFQDSLAQRQRPHAFMIKQNGAYRPVSSDEVGRRVAAVSAGLRALGVKTGDRVAIVSENRLEWAISDYAILHLGAVTVPIYATLQAATVQTM